MWPLPPSSQRAEITLPRARRPRFMLTPSLKRSPVAPVFLARSLPARSTILTSNTLKYVLHSTRNDASTL
ncbi:hypothetical protein E2C01_004306 [Portunus trituberculatus]|uniref:Uncharacterized protein n=1 Tax=Portunus trituberculatus TaxID=210409 RepID=A0A5B7CTP7_PORTR|nr:hypothetical protein [Portunus trituberculatus]